MIMHWEWIQKQGISLGRYGAVCFSQRLIHVGAQSPTGTGLQICIASMLLVGSAGVRQNSDAASKPRMPDTLHLVCSCPLALNPKP